MIYGHKWVSSYGIEDDGTWAGALGRLTGVEIKRGLSACLTRAEPWPPTLVEFLHLCRPPQPYYGPVYRSLPGPPCDPEIARAYLAQMRAQLGMPPAAAPTGRPGVSLP